MNILFCDILIFLLILYVNLAHFIFELSKKKKSLEHLTEFFLQMTEYIYFVMGDDDAILYYSLSEDYIQSWTKDKVIKLGMSRDLDEGDSLIIKKARLNYEEMRLTTVCHVVLEKEWCSSVHMM